MRNVEEGLRDEALVIAVSSLALAAVSTVFIWMTKSDSRMKARFPTILWIDLVFAALHSMNLALSYLQYFGDSYAKCQPAASFVEGLEWFAASAFIGRCCMFYMSSRSNGMIGKLPSFVEVIMDKLAYCTSSGQYFAFKNLLDLQRQLEKRKTSSARQASAADLLQKKRLSVIVIRDVKEVRAKVSRFQFKFLQGDERIIVCATLWFLFGFITSTVETFALSAAFRETLHQSSTECWHSYIRYQTSFLFLGVAFVCGLLLYISSRIQDLVGVRKEFISQFALILLVKLANGLNLAIAIGDFAYFDLVSVFLVPLIVLSITALYVVFPPCEELVHNGQMNWKDVERIWLISETGKMRIIEIAKKLYMSESIKFLEATDDITEDNLTDSVFKNLCKFFIHADSMQQINISHKLRKQWEEVARRASGAGSDFQLLSSTRMEMFMLLAPEIMKSLKDFKIKTVRSTSLSALSFGRQLSFGRKSSGGRATPRTGSISDRHSSDRDKDRNLTKLSEVMKSAAMP